MTCVVLPFTLTSSIGKYSCAGRSLDDNAGNAVTYSVFSANMNRIG